MICGCTTHTPQALAGRPAAIHRDVEDCGAAIERAKQVGVSVGMQATFDQNGSNYSAAATPPRARRRANVGPARLGTIERVARIIRPVAAPCEWKAGDNDAVNCGNRTDVRRSCGVPVTSGNWREGIDGVGARCDEGWRRQRN